MSIWIVKKRKNRNVFSYLSLLRSCPVELFRICQIDIFFDLSSFTKVGRVFPMVVFSILPHAEFGRNDHREDTPHFIYRSVWREIRLIFFQRDNQSEFVSPVNTTVAYFRTITWFWPDTFFQEQHFRIFVQQYFPDAKIIF